MDEGDFHENKTMLLHEDLLLFYVPSITLLKFLFHSLHLVSKLPEEKRKRNTLYIFFS